MTRWGYGENGHPFTPDRASGRCRYAGAGYCSGSSADSAHDGRFSPGDHVMVTGEGRGVVVSDQGFRHDPLDERIFADLGIKVRLDAEGSGAGEIVWVEAKHGEVKLIP